MPSSARRALAAVFLAALALGAKPLPFLAPAVTAAPRQPFTAALPPYVYRIGVVFEDCRNCGLKV